MQACTHPHAHACVHTRRHTHTCAHTYTHTHALTCTHMHCPNGQDSGAPMARGKKKYTDNPDTQSNALVQTFIQKKKERSAVGRILCYVTILVPMTMNIAKKRRQLCRLAKWILIHFSSSPPPFVAVVISLENRQLRSIAWLFKYHSTT